MYRWFARRQLAAFEKAYDYDASYMAEILDASPTAFKRFSAVPTLAHHCENLPKAAAYAAKMVTLLSEDCGPCTQLNVDMAQQEGVPASVLRGVLDDNEALMGPDAALGAAFARATLARDLSAIDALRVEVLRRWGRRALVSLALGIAAVRVFPTVKYALGHGASCSRIRIAGDQIAVGHERLAAPAPAPV